MTRPAAILTLVLSASLVAPSFAQITPGAGFIDQWDLNGDGEVTLAEAREKRGEVFTMFDMNENDQFEVEEWNVITEHVAAESGAGGGLEGLGAGKGPGMAIHASLTPEFNDADGNGIVTREEFTAATDQLFPHVDRNGDGLITVADFGKP